MAKRPPSEAAEAPRRALDAGCRIAVLHGEESLLRALYTRQLQDALVAAHGEVDTVQFDGAATPAGDILDECRSFGLMAPHKLVIVDNADQGVKGEEARRLYERYAQSAIDGHADNATLVLRSDTWRAGNLDKLVARVGVVMACEPLVPDKAAGWAVARAKKEHGATLERDAAALLVERVGVSLAKLDSELGKLSAAGGGTDPTITRDLVVQFVGRSREEEVWGIQSTMLGHDPERALAHLRSVLDVSRQPPTLVSYALVDLSRKVHGAARGMRQGMSAWDLARPLRLWGPSKDAILDAARNLSPARAMELMRFCIDADARQKTGRGEQVRTLERMAVRLSSIA